VSRIAVLLTVGACPYADPVNLVQDDFSAVVAGITAHLAARHDGLTVARAVTEGCDVVLSAAATGVLVTDPRGGFGVLAASDEATRFVELLQAQTEAGPCPECVTSNTRIAVPDLAAERERWPAFVEAAGEAGFGAAYAFPMRLVDRAVGGLNVFFAEAVRLSAGQLRQGQALADLAVLGLTQERDQRRVERLAEQTLTTLNDRVHVGQAVGILVGSLDLAPDVARTRLAEYSARTGRSLREVAQGLTDGSVTAEAVGETAS
jgi:hypothetical protein